VDNCFENFSEKTMTSVWKSAVFRFSTRLIHRFTPGFAGANATNRFHDRAGLVKICAFQLHFSGRGVILAAL